MFEKIALYFQYPFVRYALIVAILIALCAALLGVTLVLKRFSYIGDGLSHVAFGTMSVAMVMSLTNNMLLVLPVTVIAAILLIRTGNNAKIKGDALIAMMSVGSLAVGYLLLNVFPTSGNISGDVCSTLFGSTSIITLSKTMVILCLILSCITLVLFALFYNKIFAVTFDENFSKATGIKTEVYNTLVAIITAVIVVLAMNLVGSLLISALVIFPALSSMRVCKTYKGVVITSSILSVCCAIFGIFASILANTPVGPTIVVANIFAFVICYVTGIILRKKVSNA